MSSLAPNCAATFPGIGGGFNGCSSGNTTVLETCCSSVGGTVTSSNGTCGCSFNSAFAPSKKGAFVDCSTNDHFVSACSTPNPSAATALPIGCSFQGPEHIPQVSGSFLGAYLLNARNNCTASVGGALQQCCSQVGSAPALVNGTCGSPFNSVFTPALRLNWSICVTHSSFAVDNCNLVFKPSSAPTVPLPLNAAAIILGFSLTMGMRSATETDKVLTFGGRGGCNRLGFQGRTEQTFVTDRKGVSEAVRRRVRDQGKEEMCAHERKKDEESCIATNCKSQEVSATSLHIPTKAEIHPKNPKGGTPTGSRVKHGACPYAVDQMDMIRGGVALCAIRAVVYIMRANQVRKTP
ncbi:hypothetical protein B0H13DRAFT_1860507 [Mycena leptocephala]|nr:hypothetical protein B0H13DRAFT_1860507 [Mycena leptocephala]